MKTKLNFIQAGAEVKRYHTVLTIQQETVGHHSHGVATMCLMLQPEASRALLVSALLHDLSEHQTGDIPSPAKRQYGIGEQVSELEDRLLAEVGLMMPPLSDKEKRVLKLADIAQGAMFCAREIALGNRGMRKIFDRYISYAEDYILTYQEQELFNAIKDEVNK